VVPPIALQLIFPENGEGERDRGKENLPGLSRAITFIIVDTWTKASRKKAQTTNIPPFHMLNCKPPRD
jgi:hypothetical protein